jgi:hypothetical protein
MNVIENRSCVIKGNVAGVLRYHRPKGEYSVAAVLRVISNDYNSIADRHILVVDCFYPDGEKEDRTYLITAASHDISTSVKLRAYIENDIILQRTAIPNWVGEMWKSTQV